LQSLILGFLVLEAIDLLTLSTLSPLLVNLSTSISFSLLLPLQHD